MPAMKRPADPPFELRPIPAAGTRPLRQRILRPGQRLEELIYPGDDAPESLHLGAFDGARLLGVASLYAQSPEGSAPAPGDWRLRGMAVVPEARRRGVGAALVRACEAHARARGGTRLWFNARVEALPFYFALGYVAVGDPYELPGIGLHRFAAKDLGSGGP
jgi:GNAT superfamily N-acetyltransferase